MERDVIGGPGSDEAERGVHPDPVAGGEKRWRVGRTLGRTLYVDDVVVGMVDTPELAENIVAAMNAPGYEDYWLRRAAAAEVREGKLREALERIDVMVTSGGYNAAYNLADDIAAEARAALARSSSGGGR